MFECLIKAFGSYRSLVYKKFLPRSGWQFIRLNNKFVFTDPESPIINILYGWSGIRGQFGVYYFMFSFTT